LANLPGNSSNPLGHGLNSAFTPFSQQQQQMQQQHSTGSTSPWASPASPVGRKSPGNLHQQQQHHGYGSSASMMSNPSMMGASGYMMTGNNGPFGGLQSGGRFRRSTSYPGKNNVFGSAQSYHMAPPTLEVTNIDENSDYLYQVLKS